MAACIQLTNLTKRFGKVLAVDGLSLEVQTGEVLGLLGPNGAGKSTTLYMLAGLVAPTSGTIAVFGRDLKRAFLEIAPRMGVLVESPAFYDYLTARDNLLISARLAGRTVTVDRALDRVGLLYAAGRKAGALSTGMRQRLGLARALLLDPELLILDEPASGLDPESTQEMLLLLHTLAAESNVTIVFSSHMLHEVEALCDRVAVIHEGRLVACEKTESLLSYDQSRVEVLLEGAETAGKKLAEQPWVASVKVRSGRIEVALREPNVSQLIGFLMGCNYRINGVIPRRRTLQDYFMKVMKGGARDAGQDLERISR